MMTSVTSRRGLGSEATDFHGPHGSKKEIASNQFLRSICVYPLNLWLASKSHARNSDKGKDVKNTTRH